MAALLAAFLVGAPVSALTVERSAHAATVSAIRAHRMVGHHVPALQAAVTASLATAFALAGLTVLLVCAGTIAHCLLERRRLAAWEAEWAAQAARR